MDELTNTILWNPWHGCQKVSTGCLNCYMYSLDKARGIVDSNVVKKTAQYDLPLKQHRDKTYVIQENTRVLTCMTSDFFVADADSFRAETWEMMKYRTDLFFIIPTKRPERVQGSLPVWWGTGLENVCLSVSTENQEMADLRIPILLSLPFKHKGVMASPLIENIDIQKYLDTKQIEKVTVAGENYNEAREFRFDWALNLREQCRRTYTTFSLYETGSNFVINGKRYIIPIGKQKKQAEKANIDLDGRGSTIKLTSLDKQISFI